MNWFTYFFFISFRFCLYNASYEYIYPLKPISMASQSHETIPSMCTSCLKRTDNIFLSVQLNWEIEAKPLWSLLFNYYKIIFVYEAVRSELVPNHAIYSYYERPRHLHNTHTSILRKLKNIWESVDVALRHRALFSKIKKLNITNYFSVILFCLYRLWWSHADSALLFIPKLRVL
jgi:hypothetical protein